MSVCGSDTERPPLRTPEFVLDDLVHRRGWAAARVLVPAHTGPGALPACLEYAPLECRKTPDV